MNPPSEPTAPAAPVDPVLDEPRDCDEPLLEEVDPFPPEAVPAPVAPDEVPFAAFMRARTSALFVVPLDCEPDPLLPLPPPD